MTGNGKFRASLGVVIVVVVMAGCSGGATTDTTSRDSAGQVTASGEVGVFKLRLGDCIPLSELEGVGSTDEMEEVEHFDAIPCDQPHAGEVILVEEDFFAAKDSLPSQEELGQQSQERCVAAVEEYTGEPYESSPHDVLWVVPTPESWDADDRGLTCIGVTLAEDGQSLAENTGSIRATQ